MVAHIEHPSLIEAAGTKPKQIEEYVGRVNTDTSNVSIARMKSPEGWEEPGQNADFDEYTLVLSGTLRVESHHEKIDVCSGQAIVAPREEWVRYSTPFQGGAEYLAVCVPAFSPQTVHRDDE